MEQRQAVQIVSHPNSWPTDFLSMIKWWLFYATKFEVVREQWIQKHFSLNSLFVKPFLILPVLPIIPCPKLKLAIPVFQSPSLYLYRSTDSSCLWLSPDDEFLKGSNCVSHFCILRAVSSTWTLTDGPSIPFSISIMHKRDKNWQRSQIWCVPQAFLEFWLSPCFWAATQCRNGMHWDGTMPVNHPGS